MPSYGRFREEVRQVQARHPHVELYLAWSGPSEPIILHVIRTRPIHRGRGLGEAALQDVLAMADRLRAPLRLVAEPMAGDDTDLSRLIGWYVRKGFEVVEGRSGDQTVVTQRPVGGLPPA
jgi:GNAT superfamily N-acetyltransferase